MKDDVPLQRLASELLESLDRWDKRLQGHHEENRIAPRTSLPSKMTALVPSGHRQTSNPDLMSGIEVWCRNISRQGMAFIHAGQLKADQLTICLDSCGAGAMWVQAEVIRSRMVHPEFWEYGVVFTGRISI